MQPTNSKDITVMCQIEGCPLKRERFKRYCKAHLVNRFTPSTTNSNLEGELDHELLMLYGKVCSEHGYLSYQAVTMRMDIAALWMNYTANQKIVEAAEFQIGIEICNKKLGIWGLSIAHKGKQVFGDIYRSEQEAKDAVPSVIAELKQKLNLEQSQEE